MLARRYQRLEQVDVSRRPHGINEFQPADPSIVAEHGGDGGVCLVLGSGKAVRAVLDAIGQDIEIYADRSELPCPYSSTRKLAAIDTDLASKDSKTQERLINWGYALCDAAVRTWFDRGLARPVNFPYPASGV